MSTLLDMVVAKGRTVVHDGKTYGQHSRIRLSPEDAVRLEAMGFVLKVSVVRGLLSDPDDGGAGDHAGGGDDDTDARSADDGTGTAGDSSADTSASKTAGKNAKKTGA